MISLPGIQPLVCAIQLRIGLMSTVAELESDIRRNENIWLDPLVPL